MLNTTLFSSSKSKEVIIADFFASVYKWMTGALALSAFVAWKTATTPAFINYLMTHSGLFFLLIIAQFACVIFLGAGLRRMSYGTAIAFFLTYSVLTGLTLSTIFLVYTSASIFKAFAATVGMFAVTSLYGYTTKRDLSGFGSFLFMSLIGIIIASVLNFWLHSHMIEWVTTYAGIIVFAGLAAYDHQKLKAIALVSGDGEMAKKLAIHGALTLYLDFINLFLFLLRAMGNRR